MATLWLLPSAAQPALQAHPRIRAASVWLEVLFLGLARRNPSGDFSVLCVRSLVASPSEKLNASRSVDIWNTTSTNHRSRLVPISLRPHRFCKLSRRNEEKSVHVVRSYSHRRSEQLWGLTCWAGPLKVTLGPERVILNDGSQPYLFISAKGTLVVQAQRPRQVSTDYQGPTALSFPGTVVRLGSLGVRQRVRQKVHSSKAA